MSALLVCLMRRSVMSVFQETVECHCYAVSAIFLNCTFYSFGNLGSPVWSFDSVLAEVTCDKRLILVVQGPTSLRVHRIA
ncbi:hypothetical protein EDB83DRAFT_2385180 [Lactarius deliciosus]|nr:hypothetical protein EDB83DRAFT_2385180 [Lactarius deliciosus]